MKLAVLGVDEESLAFVAGLIAGGHELTAAFDADEQLDRVRQIAPHVRTDEDWEAALLGSALDCVVVASSRADRSGTTGISATERRDDQLRKLAQSGAPAVVVHPACEAIVGFEIEMIRRDCQGVLIPYFPGLLRAEFAELAELATAGEASKLGAVEQIVFERYQADRSRAAVLGQFARDVVLLQKLIGEIRKVSATGPAGVMQADPLGPKSKIKLSLTNLSVHLVGESGRSARWSIAPGDDKSRGVLTLTGSRGQTTLALNGSEPSDNDAWSARLGEFFRGTEALPLTWIDACRATEATAAIDRSLERGRTIELYHEEHTEEQTFKGVMAVGGCLILFAALVAVLLATVVEGLQLPFRKTLAWRLWPAYLLAPIVLFLLMQFLKNVIKRDRPVVGEREV